MLAAMLSASLLALPPTVRCQVDRPQPILRGAFDDADAPVVGPAVDEIQGPGEPQTWFLVPGMLGDGLRTIRPHAFQITMNRSLPRRAGTIAFWMKPDFSSEADGNKAFFVVKSRNGEPHDNWQMQWLGRRHLLARAGEMDGADLHVRRMQFMDGQWVHLAMTWDVEGVALYVDGEKAASNRKIDLSIEPDNEICIGSWHDGTRWAGALFDEFEVYDRRLTDKQIARMAGGAIGMALGARLSPQEVEGAFAGPVPEPSADQPDLLLHLDFEEFPTDLTRIVKPTNGEPQVKQIAGRIGKAVACNAGGIGVNVSGVFPRSEGTVALWVRPNWEPGHGESKVFFHVPADGRTVDNYHIQTYGGQLSARASAMGGDAEPGASVYSKKLEDWTAGQWYFLVLTWDADCISLYIDGKAVAQASPVSYPCIPGGRLSIGCWSDGTRCADAVIDEFRLYTKALQPQQVQGLYKSDTAD